MDPMPRHGFHWHVCALAIALAAVSVALAQRPRNYGAPGGVVQYDMEKIDRETLSRVPPPERSVVKVATEQADLRSRAQNAVAEAAAGRRGNTGDATRITPAQPGPAQPGPSSSTSQSTPAARTATSRATDKTMPSQAQPRRLPDRDATGRVLPEHQNLEGPAPTGIAAAGIAEEGNGQPGGRELEGVQSPSVTLEKTAPAEMQVGKPAVLEIKVHNVGQAAAQGVQILDEIPKGSRLASTSPRARTNERGQLVWDVGTLRPGAAAKVKMEVIPLTEGLVGSVASVVIRAEASSRSVVTKPQLTMKVSAPKQMLIGEQAIIAISLANLGSGAATGVVIEADLPAELHHEAGRELEFEIGTLKPKETRKIELVMSAEKAARVAARVAARAEAIGRTEERAVIEILAPQLEVALTGPKRRFLDRKATYTVTVSNPGTATANDIELTTILPKGMKFVEANNHGAYDAAKHAVLWSLEELPADRQGDVTVTLVAIEPGEQKLRVEGRSKEGLADDSEETVSVEGVAGLSVQVVDLADPIEVGSDASYEIHVVNSGSKSASNVQVVVQLPKELQPADAQGPTAHEIRGNAVAFEPISRLAAKERKTFKIKAQAVGAGDLRIAVEVKCDDLSQPITQQEVTRAFSDK
jgi:uncharacterized repeat protein (TIGR01451 family)